MARRRVVVQLKLIDRKQLLDEVVQETPYIKKVPYILEQGDRLFRETVIPFELEGVVSKPNSSPYVGRRA